MLWFSTRATIGIDVSDHVIRAVEVTHARTQSRITRFAEVAVPPGAIIHGDILRDEQVHDALHTLLRHHFDIEHATAVVSLPESHAFLKTILLQNGDLLENELPKHLPFPVTDVIFDSLSHGTIDRDGVSAFVTSFAAIPKHIAEQYADVMAKARLHCRALEVESQAIARLYAPTQTPEQVVVLVDLGKNHSTVIMIAEGRIDVTHASLEITAASHEKLGAEIQRVVRFHTEHGPKTASVKDYTISLTGGGSQIPGLVEQLKKETQLPVSVATLPNTIRIPAQLRETVFSYNTAIGLAMREYFPL